MYIFNSLGRIFKIISLCKWKLSVTITFWRIQSTSLLIYIWIHIQQISKFWINELLQVYKCQLLLGFPGGSDGKESACNAGDLGLIPGFGRSSGKGNAYSLQYSCLENSMDREACWATVHGVAKSWTWLSST